MLDSCAFDLAFASLSPLATGLGDTGTRLVLKKEERCKGHADTAAGRIMLRGVNTHSEAWPMRSKIVKHLTCEQVVNMLRSLTCGRERSRQSWFKRISHHKKVDHD